MADFIKALTGRTYPISGGFWNGDPSYPASLKPHIGEDYPLSHGTPLKVFTYIIVTRIGGHADYGKQIFMYDPNNDLSYHLGHLSWINPEVKVGDGRYIGYHIANSGATGMGYDGVVISNGVVPHLHLSVAKGRISDTGKSHSWVSASQLGGVVFTNNDGTSPKPIVPESGLRIGDRVIIKANATDLNTNTNYDNWIYSTHFTFLGDNGKGYMFGKDKNTITGVVARDMLEKIEDSSYIKPDPILRPETAKFYPDRTINVRDYPSRTEGKIITQYYKGESVQYDSYVETDDHVWISYISDSGIRRYMAIRTYDNGRYGAKWGVIT